MTIPIGDQPAQVVSAFSLPEFVLRLTLQVVLSMSNQTWICVAPNSPGCTKHVKSENFHNKHNENITAHVYLKHDLAIEYWLHDPKDYPAPNIPKGDSQVW